MKAFKVTPTDKGYVAEVSGELDMGVHGATADEAVQNLVGVLVALVRKRGAESQAQKKQLAEYANRLVATERGK